MSAKLRNQVESDSDTSRMSIDSPPESRASQMSPKKYQAEQASSDMTKSTLRHTQSSSKKSGAKEDFNQSDSDRSDSSEFVTPKKAPNKSSRKKNRVNDDDSDNLDSDDAGPPDTPLGHHSSPNVIVMPNGKFKPAPSSSTPRGRQVEVVITPKRKKNSAAMTKKPEYVIQYTHSTLY